MRRLLVFAALVFGLSGGGWLGLTRFEREAVYHFDPRRIAPAEAGLRGFSEIQFRSGGDASVIWVAPAAGDKPVIFYLHGNAGGLADRAERFRQLAARGYGVIAPAYRGSSGSSGTPSEAAITRDMRRIWRKLDQIMPGAAPDRVIVYGESLGAAVAMKLLAGDAVAAPLGVVLEAPFSSLPDMVRHVSPKLAPLIPLMRNIWDSERHARRLTAPLLVLQGTADMLIPAGQTRRVLAAAGSRDKHLHPVPGADHNEIWGEDSLPVLWAFIDRL